MRLGSTFSVPAESDRVFELFLDPQVMQACIPGCRELVRVDQSHYTGTLTNEIAHVRFNATFSAEIVSIEVPREVRAVLKGEDRKLASSLQLDATLTVEPDGSSSHVTYAMEMALWGRLGRMGESIFRRRTAEVEKQFVEAFSRACQGLPLEQAPAGAAQRPTAAVITKPAAAAAEGEDAAESVSAVPATSPLSPAKAAAAAGMALFLVLVGWRLGRRSAGSSR